VTQEIFEALWECERGRWDQYAHLIAEYPNACRYIAQKFWDAALLVQHTSTGESNEI